MKWLASPLVRALRDPRSMSAFDAIEWDLLVRQASSAGLLARLRAHAGSVTVHVVPGVGHVGLLKVFYSARLSPLLAQSVEWIQRPKPVALPPGS